MAKYQYEIEINEALIMMQRVTMLQLRDCHLENGNQSLADTYNLYYKEMGIQLRRMLRQRGYERDCEISPEMEQLAVTAQKALTELMNCICLNAPNTANLLAKHGCPALLDWQTANPVPWRPDRRH